MYTVPCRNKQQEIKGSQMSMLSPHCFQVQEVLFPHLQEKIGPLGSNHERLVSIIEFSGEIIQSIKLT